MIRGEVRILGALLSLLLAALVHWRRVDALPVGGGGGRFQGDGEDPLGGLAMMGDGREDEEEVFGVNKRQQQQQIFESPNNRGVSQSGRGVEGGLRGLYFDSSSSSFLPYVHPKFIYADDLPPFFVPRGSNWSKRATKGMMVDVVDFVAKGGSSGQRLGQDMRSSGRKRRSLSSGET